MDHGGLPSGNDVHSLRTGSHGHWNHVVVFPWNRRWIFPARSTVVHQTWPDRVCLKLDVYHTKTWSSIPRDPISLWHDDVWGLKNHTLIMVTILRHWDRCWNTIIPSGSPLSETLLTFVKAPKSEKVLAGLNMLKNMFQQCNHPDVFSICSMYGEHIC